MLSHEAIRERTEEKLPTRKYVIEVDSSSIDVAIEKANRLVMLLREAATIIDSLSSGGG